MGCACKVKQQMDDIQRLYGTNIPPSKKSDIIGYLKNLLKKSLLFILTLPLFPLVFIFVVVRMVFTKSPLKLDKLVKRKK